MHPDDIAAAAVDAAETAYRRFVADVEAINWRWADENIDAENCVDHAAGTLEYWGAMLDSAIHTAAIRAEAEGQDLNALLGRIVY